MNGDPTLPRFGTDCSPSWLSGWLSEATSVE